MQVLGPILLFGAIVLVHELGHFLAARLTGMRADEFSLGVGPALWQHKGKQTLFSLRLIPVISYVRIAGMEIEDADKDPEDGFNRKPFWARFLVLFAGSGMNVVLAFVLAVSIALFVGFPKGMKIAALSPNMPASNAGLQVGDRIARINDVVDPEFEQFVALVKDGETVSVTVERDGKMLPPVSLTGQYVKSANIWRVGVGPETAYFERHAFLPAVVKGAEMTGDFVTQTIEVVGMLFTGRVHLKELLSFVGIIRISSDASAEVGKSPDGAYSFLFLFALVSANIGILNLVPFPGLDGSHILIQFIETISRKRFDRMKLAYFMLAGIGLLFAFIMVISVRDLINWVTGAPLGGKLGMEVRYPLPRRQTRAVRVGSLSIGGGAPVSVQTMAKTPTADVAATVAQIHRAEEAGCHLVRVGVPDEAAARALGAIVRAVGIPVVADIHFDYRLALIALEQGVAKLRLNPGNLRNAEHVRAVVASAKERGVPIRVGVNNGSVPEATRQQYGFTPEGNAKALVACALEHLTILEELDFADVVVSLKASDVRSTVLAYRMMAETRDYPLHVGVTEAGLAPEGLVKSSIGMGQLLGEGIGDTIRVSLTGDPVDEVEAGWQMLRALDLREGGITLTSCPKCARCDVDFEPIVHAVKARLHPLDRSLRQAGVSLHVAVMGCEVNGPGEARDADIGLASGVGVALLMRDGVVLRKVPESEMVTALVAEVESLAREKM